MMTTIIYYLSFVLPAVFLLALCIFIHELGHLLGGKLVGIKARVFSIGFGKGIIKKKIGDTTYQLAPIPLGGYCQFYGEDPSEERTGEGYEFLSAHPLRRIVTVAMGPLFNLFFGIILFFVMNLVGYTTETNRIYIPERFHSGANVSPAYAAGLRTSDKIVEINEKNIREFTDIKATVMLSDGIPLKIKYERNGSFGEITLNPKKDERSGRYAIGVSPFGSNVIIQGVVKDDVAQKAGLEKMDIVEAINGISIKNPQDFVNNLKTKANQKVILSIIRSDVKKEIELTPRINEFIILRDKQNNVIMEIPESMFGTYAKENKFAIGDTEIKSFDQFKELIQSAHGKEIAVVINKESLKCRGSINPRGFIGAAPSLNPEMILVQYGFGDALIQAFVEPFEFIAVTLKGLGSVVGGKLNFRENVSGPIKIAQIAGYVAYYKGLAAFIILMAKISIVLMVMNFLPIPVVDGGHLVFFTIEAIRGKPLNEKVMQVIQTAGIVLLITLGVFVIINDILTF